jgi:alkanesulfonate monooxygenase SsuD/methylene tetrahydromethanopterin reductase-like flavin-dependent oxidoreductase (luciferase family)
VAKIGVFVNPEPQTPVAEIIEQGRTADRQGFDSVWLGDHLIDYRGRVTPDGPPDSFTVMTAIGAVTERIRLAWGMLNPSFRNPALLAKMLATLDHVTQGRVICSLGAGWLKPEYEAYDVPFVEDHDERIAHEREVVRRRRRRSRSRASTSASATCSSTPLPSRGRTRRSGSAATPRRRSRSRASSGTAGFRSCEASRTSCASCVPRRRGPSGRSRSSG